MTTRILIVDDDSVTRKSLSALLKEFGHNALALESGEKAIKMVKRREL